MIPDDDLLPLFAYSLEDIRARLDADANAGVEPTDPDFVDTREGSFFFISTQPAVLEFARLWDALGNDVPAASFIAFAWGDYLDYHAASASQERKAGTPAKGTCTFEGPEGTIISAGVLVGTNDPGDDTATPTYTVDAQGTIGGGGSIDLTVTATDIGVHYNVSAGAIVNVLSPIGGVTVSNAAAIEGGTEVESDELLRGRLMQRFPWMGGGGNVADYKRWVLDLDSWNDAPVNVERVEVEPIWDGAGTVKVIIMGADGEPLDVATVNNVQDYLDPAAAVAYLDGAHTLPDATIDLTDAADFASSGTVRIGDQTITYSGKSGDTLTGCSGGTGTWATGYNVRQGLGRSEGQAPADVAVSVVTTRPVPVAVVASVVFKEGYSYDGPGQAQRAAITNALEIYFNGLSAGEDVVYDHVKAQIFRARGVYSVSSITINGTTADISVSSSQIATLTLPITLV